MYVFQAEMSWWDNLLEIWISSFFTARLSAALK
jgi:hypothetical protein